MLRFEAQAPAYPSPPPQASPVQHDLSGGLTSGGLTIQAASAASPAARHLASARLATEQAVQADEAGDGAEALELYTIAIEGTPQCHGASVQCTPQHASVPRC